MSSLIIPILLIITILYANKKKVNIYSCFCKGAKSSFDLVLGIFPYIVAIMVCIALFRVSGLCNILVSALSPIFNLLGIPPQICELVLLRPFTGSGSLSILENIISTHGADSYIARCACTIMGSSETVFYVSSVYFADTKLKNVFPAIAVALVGNVISAILSCVFCRLF